MTTRSELLERFGNRVTIRETAPVVGGVPGSVLLVRSGERSLDTPGAHRALVRAGVDPRASHQAMNELFDTGQIRVDVPNLVDADLVREMALLGIGATVERPRSDETIGGPSA